MCGIVGAAGFFEPGLVQRMADTIVHRGPDGAGFAEVPQAGLSIGMRRLAIIDLATGDQPMWSPDRQVSIVYNGEIYNYRELKKELEGLGYAFKTTSDTEVVLNAFLAWGPAAWSRLAGMFAIAIIDQRDRPARLLLVRDRVGIKPLYLLRQGGRLLFASEVKAFRAWSGFSAQVDLAAVGDYLALRYVPGPGSLLSNVTKLEPGQELTFAQGEITCRTWWRPPPPTREAASLGEAEAARLFGDALRTSVHRHMVSDVPIGAFLSGGIDSNTIVALMAEVSSRPVKTFSIGFDDFDNEDQRLARLTADALGTDHTPITCSARDFADLPDLVAKLDEPVGDAIIVPMSVLAREARQSVKVVLSGEGADEILGGYLFHAKLVQIERMRRRLPRAIWPTAARIAGVTPTPILARMFDYPGSLGSEGRRKISAMLGAISDAPLYELYRNAISLFDPHDFESMGFPARRGRITSPAVSDGDLTALQRLVSYQWADWLPDDILMKADKMTMAHSLEARVPFMDELVIDAAARLPDHDKLSGGVTKRALRDFGASLLPSAVVSAPKRAFYIPLESYAATRPLSDLMKFALDPVRLRKRGLVRPEWVAAQEAQGREAGFLPLKRLFAILVLELWFEQFAPDASWA